MEKKSISVSVHEKEDVYGYHYFIRRNGLSWRAFRTEKGYTAFINRHNLQLQLTRESESEMHGKVKCYDCISEGTFNECYVWKKEQLPEGALPFTGLENGGYCTCYYHNVGNDTYEYRPNPNSGIYDKMNIDDHIKWSQENG